jgi:hypothetical protein
LSVRSWTFSRMYGSGSGRALRVLQTEQTACEELTQIYSILVMGIKWGRPIVTITLTYLETKDNIKDNMSDLDC